MTTFLLALVQVGTTIPTYLIIFRLSRVYANAKGYFKLGKINPYVSFDIGIGIPVGENDSWKAGLYISPGIGAGIHVTRWNTLSLLVAYQSQKFPAYSSAISMDAIAVKLAFGF